MNAPNARGGKLKRMIQGGALGLLAASVVLGLWRAGVLDTLEFPTWGWRVRTFAPRSSPSAQIKVILLATNVLLCVMQVGRHHVFKENTKTSPGRGERQPATQRAGSDDGDGSQEIGRASCRERV